MNVVTFKLVGILGEGGGGASGASHLSHFFFCIYLFVFTRLANGFKSGEVLELILRLEGFSVSCFVLKLCLKQTLCVRDSICSNSPIYSSNDLIK